MAKPTRTDLEKLWGEDFGKIEEYVLEQHRRGVAPDRIMDAVKKRFGKVAPAPYWEILTPTAK